MANTFVQLTDTPSSYDFSANKFARVNNAGDGIQFWDIELDYLADVQASLSYAPSVGDTLIWSADNKWRPGTLDVYSAGNGLNKSGLTLNVQAVAGGGLTSNASGIFISDIANVAGTYGNASYIPVTTVNSKGQVTAVSNVEIVATQAATLTNSFVGNVAGTSGQIRVTGGTGVNSNATIDLVATGVTAAVYGNATHLPAITVDTYGRIQNVDMIQVSGGNSSSSGNVLNWKDIVVSGQTTISSDAVNDTLTFVAGTGTTITTQANADSITFGVNAGQVAGQIDLNDLQNINASSPTNGQALVYNSGSSQWEPGAPTFTLGDSGVTAGTYGNSEVSARIVVNSKGQITSVSEVAIPQGDITEVVAGTGLNGGGTTGSVTLNLEQTGVTPGTYGNALVYPTFTVDALGRITNVSTQQDSGASGGIYQTLSWNSGTNVLEISNGNSVDLSVLDVPAQTLSLSGNTLSISAGNSVDLTSFAGGGGGGIDTAGVDAHLNQSNPTSGYVLSWNGSDYAWVSNAGYTDSDVDTHLNTSGASAGQVLSWNGADYAWKADADGQDLTISGNVISLSGQSGNVDLTSVLGSVTSDYGDSNVGAYLSGQGYATQSTIVAAITDSAPATLDTLNELAAALGDDPNFATTVTNSLATKANASSLHAVATSGDFDDLTNVPVISLSGSDLSFDGTTLDLSGVGAQGPQGNIGPTGATGVGITNATVSGNVLQLTYSNSTVQNVGSVVGPAGPTGATGSQGPQGIQGATGPQGAQGDQGTAGVGVTSVSIVSNNLVFNYSNTSTQDMGNIRGPVGPQGIQGATGPQGDTGAQGPQGNVGIQGPAGNVLVTTANSAPSGASEGQMWYATDDGHTYIYHNSNWVSANPGESPQTLSLAGNVITVSGSNSNVDLTTILGAVDTNTDAQTLNLSGNTLTISGSGSSVDLSSFAGGGGSAQTLGMTGTDITISGGNGVDIAQAVRDTADAHLNQSNPTSGYVLSWNGSDYAWVAQTGGDVVDDTTPQLGGDLDLNGNKLVTTSNGDIELDPNGSGVVEFRGNATRGSGSFKLNCENNSHAVTIKGPAHSAGATYTLTLPDDDGDADQVLKTDGSGNLAWVDQNSSASLDSLSDVSTSGVSSGQVLKYNGTSWAPANDSTGGGGGGSGANILRFKLNYASNGNLSGTSDLSTGINSVTINSASGGEVTIEFDNTSYNYPPGSIMFYGYDYTNNKYSLVPFETSMGYREISAGGSSGSPTLFNGSSTVQVKLRLREAETGASRGGFGTTTHAWIQFVMYD